MATDGVSMLRDDGLRLRGVRLPEDISHAVAWYHDAEVLYFSEGAGTPPYDAGAIARMYAALAAQGELYVIEIQTPQGWHPVGDVALLPDDLSIVIGEAAYRSRGIGTRVVKLLIARARALGWQHLKVAKVFTYNVRSRRLFESVGFRLSGEDTDDAGRPYWSFDRMLT